MNIDPVLLVAVPLVSGFLLSLAGKLPSAAKLALSLGLAVISGILSILLTLQVYRLGPVVSLLGAWPPRIGISLLADKASVLLVVLVSWGQVLTLLFRGSYSGSWPGKLPVFSAIFTASLLGMILTGDLFNLFVFVELSTVASVGLIVKRKRPEASVAGFVYLIVASVSGSFLLLGIILVYRTTGSLSMAVVSREIHFVSPLMYRGILACFLLSFGMKFGLVPVHLWQARAYHAAGSTATALLTGLGMKGYLFTLFRVLWVPLQVPKIAPWFFTLILYWGLSNILLGHLMGLFQKDYKKLLAFSSTAHAGYILTAAGIAGSLGLESSEGFFLGASALAGGLFHMLNHSLVKCSLLWTGASFLRASSSSKISSLRASYPGIGVFILGALSIAGIPPTGGFASKWFIALGAPNVLPILVIALGTVISAAYYARVVFSITPLDTGHYGSSHETFKSSLVPLIVPGILALGVLVFGFLSPVLMPVFRTAAQTLMDSTTYAQLMLGSGL
jgi:multicomponent Na+:H+ antiporter subunit D